MASQWASTWLWEHSDLIPILRPVVLAAYLGRFVPLLAALALGGSLAQKKIVPASAGTFRTDGPTFVVLLVGVIALTAGLMIFPALTLGPIVEGLMH